VRRTVPEIVQRKCYLLALRYYVLESVFLLVNSEIIALPRQYRE